MTATCRYCFHPPTQTSPLFELYKGHETAIYVHERCFRIWLRDKPTYKEPEDPTVAVNPLDFEPLTSHHYITYYHHVYRWLASGDAPFATLSALVLALCVIVLIAAYVVLIAVIGCGLHYIVRYIVLDDKCEDHMSMNDLPFSEVLSTGCKNVLWGCVVLRIAFGVGIEQLRLHKESKPPVREFPETESSNEFDIVVDNPVYRHLKAVMSLSAIRAVPALIDGKDVPPQTKDAAEAFGCTLIGLFAGIIPIWLLGAGVAAWREFSAWLGIQAALTSWIPKFMVALPIDYLFILASAFVCARVLASTKLTRFKTEWHAVERTLSITATALLMPYACGAALFYAATGILVYPEATDSQAWGCLVVGAGCWCDWWTTRSQIDVIIRRTSSNTPPPKGILWSVMQFVPTILNYSLIVWVLSKLVPLHISMECRWVALLLVSLFTLLGPNQPPLAYVAWVWLNESVWMRFTVYLGSGAVPGFILIARAWCLVMVLGVLPLVLGKTAALLGLAYNLWLPMATVCLGLPVLGFYLLKYPPKELEHSARFQKWRQGHSIDWHVTSAALILLGICYTSTEEAWTLKDAFVGVLAMVWPVEWYTAVLISVFTRFGLLRLVFMAGEKRWPMQLFHYVMYHTYPRVRVPRDHQMATL